MKLAMPKLLLHIGTEKTGTSALQQFLWLNRRQLSLRSILVPAFLGRFNHLSFPFLAYDLDRLDDVVIRVAPGLAGEDLERRRQDVLRYLALKVASSGHDQWVVTSEHLSSRLLRESELARLRDLVDEFFSSVSVILYLREPLSAYVSSWSTALKTGSLDHRLSEPGTGYADRLADHRALLQRWLMFFSKKELVVRLYDRSRLLNGSIIDDFCLAAGIESLVDPVIPARANATLSLAAMRCLLRFNLLVPAWKDNDPNPLRGSVAARFESAFGNFPPYLPPVGSVRKWDEYYADSVAYVRREFFPHIDGPLWGGFREGLDADAGLCALTDVEAALVDLVAQTWMLQRARILQLKKEVGKSRY